jgi:hypothetical protein
VTTIDIDFRACLNLFDYVVDGGGEYLGTERQSNPLWIQDTRGQPKEFYSYAWIGEIAGMHVCAELRDPRYRLPLESFLPVVVPAHINDYRSSSRAYVHRASRWAAENPRNERQHILSGDGWKISWRFQFVDMLTPPNATTCIGMAGVPDTVEFAGDHDGFKRDMTAVTMTMPRELHGRSAKRYGDARPRYSDDDLGFSESLTRLRIAAKVVA